MVESTTCSKYNPAHFLLLPACSLCDSIPCMMIQHLGRRKSTLSDSSYTSTGNSHVAQKLAFLPSLFMHMCVGTTIDSYQSKIDAHKFQKVKENLIHLAFDASASLAERVQPQTGKDAEPRERVGSRVGSQMRLI